MIKLKDMENQKINQNTLVEILFYSFPLSFIIGNLFLNLHLLIFIVVSLFLIQKNKFQIRFDNSYWILIAFFLYFFLSTTIQFISPGLLNEKVQDWPFESQPIFKSFIFIRFIILIFIIDTLFLNKILKIKKLFLFSLFCTTFVGLDVILQYFTGSDIFGYESKGIRNSGPFGDETIAGGYLQKFSFLSFFYILSTYKNKNFSTGLFIFVIAFHLTAILLAGNRMPMILTLFGCFLILILIKNLRLVMTLSLIVFLSVFALLAKNDHEIEESYVYFIKEVNIFNVIDVSKLLKKDKAKNIEVTHELEGQKTEWTEGVWKKNWQGVIFLDNSGYNRIFRTAYMIWKEQPLIGFGLKSFRIKCWEVGPKNRHLQPQSKISIFSCSNHPHNYYLEFLSETGLIGTILLIIFFIIILKNSFYTLKKYKQSNDEEIFFLIPIILVIILEIWPLRSTGSFFTTWNATFFWLSVGILLSNKKKII